MQSSEVLEVRSQSGLCGIFVPAEGPYPMICLASDSSAVLLLSSAPVTFSSALRALVWSVATMRLEEPLSEEDVRELAEFWDRGGATRSMLALFSASLSFPVAIYISTESWMRHEKSLSSVGGAGCSVSRASATASVATDVKNGEG